MSEPRAVTSAEPGQAVAADSSTSSAPDTATLAKGGRTNFLGFLLRLVARLPFLYFAGRWYGAETLGRFAYAVIVVEFAAQLATLGLKRGLAQELSSAQDADHPHIIWDAILGVTLASLVLAGVLAAVPQLMFPNSGVNGLDRMFPLVIIAIAGTDIALAALAYRFDIGATVRARSVVEPWAISIAAFVLAFYSLRDGLILSYAIAMVAAYATALWPLVRSYGPPRGWVPRGSRLLRLARTNAPLAAADAIEWGSRRVDILLLGLVTTNATVGIYYVAQQVASLPQKLKTSFDPILGPVITQNLAEGRLSTIAQQVGQVGFWIVAMQTGVALALGIPAAAIMGLTGPDYVIGVAPLLFLLAAEVVAATAVVSEAGLIYIDRHRNLIVSVATILFQILLSLALFAVVRHMGWPPIHYATAAAAALMASLALASVIKVRLLQRRLNAPIRIFRWALLWATAGATVLGFLATRLPEWAELLIGVPVILGGYAWLIWTRGFTADDRALFARDKKTDGNEAAARSAR